MADIFVTSKPRDVSKGGSRGDVFIFSHISVGSIQFITKTGGDISSEPRNVPTASLVADMFRQLAVTASTNTGQTRASLRVYMLVVKRFLD